MGQYNGTDPELSYRVHRDNSQLRPLTLPVCDCATQSRTPKQMGHKHGGLLLNVSKVLAQILHWIVPWAWASCTRAQFIAHWPCSPAMSSAMLLLWVNGQSQPKLWEKPQEKHPELCSPAQLLSAWRHHTAHHKVWVQPSQFSLRTLFKLLKMLSFGGYRSKFSLHKQVSFWEKFSSNFRRSCNLC